MDHVEYAYTAGMDETAVAERLAAAGTGVLALAMDDDAYAVPIAHYYDGDSGRLYFRLGVAPGGEKADWLAATETATYVVYGTDETDDPDELASWSVVVRGQLRELPAAERERFDDAEINRRFSPVRVFDEAVDEVDVAVYELAVESLTGRRTTTE